MEIFRSTLHGFFAFFWGVLDWNLLILVWFERSLHSAQVTCSGQSCAWPLKLMTSQEVEGMWIHMGGYEWFRGKSGLLIFCGKKSKISRDFQGQIRGKIGRFHGILAGKSQFSKDFQGQILRKIGRFHGKFRGETSPRNNQWKTADFAGFVLANLTGIIICSFNNSLLEKWANAKAINIMVSAQFFATFI